ncbi:unnamed protein product, partial [Hymenolepis diminuta]
RRFELQLLRKKFWSEQVLARIVNEKSFSILIFSGKLYHFRITKDHINVLPHRTRNK